MATYTSDGETLVVDLIDNTVAAATMFVGWGSATSAEAKGDTALGAEFAEDRSSGLTISQPTSDTNQWVGSVTAATSHEVAEGGLFNASSGGKMMIRGLFSTIALSSGDSIEFTFQLQQS